MEKVIKSDVMKVFQNFLIQYHRFIDNHVERRNAITSEMETHYKNIFNNEFVWEGWGVKNY
jgi:hypothetical protein